MSRFWKFMVTCFVAVTTFSVATVQKVRRRVAFYLAAAASLLTVALLPAGALAVESKTEEGIKTVTTQVSSEGVSIILAVLAGLVALIAAVIVIPKAIGFIKRFV